MFDDLLGTLAGDASLSYDPNSGLSAGINAGVGGASYAPAPYGYDVNGNPLPPPSIVSPTSLSPTMIALIAGAILLVIILK